ncbi:MAG: hypothetical protein HY664_08090 [Chloroflexi bacterium]|nr:hypothetical protein [Chloroflexota bacterium]
MTEEWLHIVQDKLGKQLAFSAEAQLVRVGHSRATGLLLIIMILIFVPVWIVGLALLKLPVLFFLIVGILTALGLAIGVFMVRT